MQDASKPIWINKPDKVVELKQSPTRIFVATPVHSEVSVHYARAILEFQKECMKNNILVSFSMIKSSLVTQGRNLCVSQFLEAKEQYTHLLFIDSDIEFKPSTIFEMIKKDKELIACPYPMKTFNWEKMVKRINKSEVNNAEELSKSGFTFPLKVPNKEEIHCKEGVIELSHAPTGCMLIKREVFDKMIKAYPDKEIVQPTIINGKEITRPFFYNFFDCIHDPETKNYYGEDFGFCRLWTKIGGKCYGYIMDDVTHVGDHLYSGRLYDDLLSLKKVDEPNKNK
jgi:hypothetical protein